ncbi:MAG TPA: hypothetical protein VF579_14125 [Candidatus Methylomirabilis sp.]
MSTKTPTPIQQALEQIEGLDADDQRAVIEIVRQRLVERRRAEIAENVRSAVRAFREGKARYGTVSDLCRDLAEDR